MIWLLQDLDLLGVLARALLFAFEALTLGGIAYLWSLTLWPTRSGQVTGTCRRMLAWCALGLAFAEVLAAGISCASLIGGSQIHLGDLVSTDFFRAGAIAGGAAILIAVCARLRGRSAAFALLPLGLVVLAADVSTSHAMARLEHRALLATLTAAHHVGTAIWIGAMPYMLVCLRSSDPQDARTLARRFSVMAQVGVAALVLAGIGMAWYYVGSWSGLYGTDYGVLLLAKIYLLLLMLSLGLVNWLLLRRVRERPASVLASLRRFAEVEICLGFTALLAAASLTSQPPAIDVTQDRVTIPELVARFRPEIPRMHSPAAAQLTPATPIGVAIQVAEFAPTGASDATDRAWSEYNHHWAGLIVLVAALLAFASRLPRMRWARFWPLTFAGLALFILLRADPETWPIGPRPFWASFSAPDVLEHRLAALLILVFAIFECAVQAGKLRARWTALIFPGMCALGAVILLTHNHFEGEIKESLLAEWSHVPIALAGATAGYGRWLEIRLPEGRASRFAGRVWPVFLAIAGLILLNYRES